MTKKLLGVPKYLSLNIYGWNHSLPREVFHKLMCLLSRQEILIEAEVRDCLQGDRQCTPANAACYFYIWDLTALIVFLSVERLSSPERDHLSDGQGMSGTVWSDA